MNRFVLCLLLVSISAVASAREFRMAGANGDGGGTCPELTAAIEEAQAPAARPRTTQAAPAPRAKSAKPAVSGGGGDGEGRVQRPRWHSFLPGMFR